MNKSNENSEKKNTVDSIDTFKVFDDATLRKILNETYSDLTPVDNMIEIAEGLFTLISELDDINYDIMRDLIFQLNRSFSLNKELYLEMNKLNIKKS
ncbi:MAG: hypothetical protein CVU05_02715 [Bacteroidetes bacterium HGW-Bacteroidetes-21]|nr:MAG: hypothetical protein CVU05_02715 [Bacteroidetes bacterium HGW-Bacteroidetes-21]